jgi:hypothetical protein
MCAINLRRVAQLCIDTCICRLAKQDFSGSGRQCLLDPTGIYHGNSLAA